MKTRLALSLHRRCVSERCSPASAMREGLQSTAKKVILDRMRVAGLFAIEVGYSVMTTTSILCCAAVRHRRAMARPESRDRPAMVQGFSRPATMPRSDQSSPASTTSLITTGLKAGGAAHGWRAPPWFAGSLLRKYRPRANDEDGFLWKILGQPSINWMDGAGTAQTKQGRFQIIWPRSWSAGGLIR